MLLIIHGFLSYFPSECSPACCWVPLMCMGSSVPGGSKLWCWAQPAPHHCLVIALPFLLLECNNKALSAFNISFSLTWHVYLLLTSTFSGLLVTLSISKHAELKAGEIQACPIFSFLLGFEGPENILMIISHPVHNLYTLRLF